MAPLQHIRSTLGKTRTSRTALAAVVLLGASLGLSACGAQQAGAAAIVNGNTISDKDVQTTSLQLDTLATAQQQVSPRLVLLNLILAPFVLAEADRTHKGVPDAQARKAIAKVANPSPATIDFVRMQLAIPSLSQASKNSILTKLAKANITVNPRYGTLDTKQAALTPTTPNWIKAGTATVAP